MLRKLRAAVKSQGFKEVGYSVYFGDDGQADRVWGFVAFYSDQRIATLALN